jgi:hypothetical protein
MKFKEKLAAAVRRRPKGIASNSDIASNADDSAEQLQAPLLTVHGLILSAEPDGLAVSMRKVADESEAGDSATMCKLLILYGSGQVIECPPSTFGVTDEAKDASTNVSDTTPESGKADTEQDTSQSNDGMGAESAAEEHKLVVFGILGMVQLCTGIFTKVTNKIIISHVQE